MTTAGGIKVTGLLCRLLMVIKTRSNSRRREFAQFCKMHGLVYHIPHNVLMKGAGDKWADETTFEVTGPAPALEKLSEKDFVVSWEMPLNVSPPRLTASTFRKDAH